MKKPFVSILIGLCGAISVRPATTITSTNKYAYGANIGWLNAEGDVASGAIIGEFVCSGYAWGANVGWIHLGNGIPANRVRYQNNSAGDYGVNHDGLGNLSGYAWGANIGWISFETNGAPKVDLQTGVLSGSVWSANCGWISLSNAFARVQTGFIQRGADADGDGITDAWELTYTNTLNAFTSLTDTDGDGVSDKDEYFADTNPLDDTDYLRITLFTRGDPTPTYNKLFWTAKPTRFYEVQSRINLGGSLWADYFVPTFPGGSALGFDDFGVQQFYRIRAFRPLLP